MVVSSITAQSTQQSGSTTELAVEIVSCGPRRNSASPGDRPVFEAQIKNLSESKIDLPLTLFVNGESPFGERMAPNIEPGEVRTILSDPILPTEGTYEYELELGEPTLA
jgi:hypothetical protein